LAVADFCEGIEVQPFVMIQFGRSLADEKLRVKPCELPVAFKWKFVTTAGVLKNL
jgi:hypothetical protein